jgi:hypothetical protein
MTLFPQPNTRQEAGEFCHSDRTLGDQAEGADIEAQLSGLEALTAAELQIEWRKLYRTMPPTRLSRDLLMRGVAYMLQVGAHGGLSLSTKRRLRSLSDGSDRRGGSSAAPAITLTPGTKLVREWHQHVHTVNVLDGGFEYRGERYNSLTRIARRITGVHWSGPLFFGIRKRQRVQGAADE